MTSLWDTMPLAEGFVAPTEYAGNLIVRSLPGGGKSTFASSAPDTLHLVFDPQGGEFLVGGLQNRMMLRTWADLKKLWGILEKDARENGDNRRYKGVWFDTIGQYVEELAFPEWCRLGGKTEVEGFDYRPASKFAMHWLNQLNKWGYSWYALDHIFKAVKGLGTTEKVVTESVLTPAFRKYLDGKCSYILTFEMRLTKRDDRGNALPKDQWKKELWASTVPNNKTSLENPKARVWLPTEFPILSIEQDLQHYGWGSFVKVHKEAVEAMVAKNSEAQAARAATT